MVRNIVILIIVVTVIGFAGLNIKNTKLAGNINLPSFNVSEAITDIGNSIIPSPTPFPFQELTIPYLQGREYQSKLGNLKQYSDNGSFATYLTDYDSDGLKINALLTRPKGTEPEGGFPAIVFVHGYIAPSVYRTTERYADYVNYLARNGFVVLKIDLRGHGSSEGLPTGSYYSGDYVIDTLNAYSALQNTDFVNPGKIGLWGHSMAGNITLRSFAAKRDIPAVSIWAGAGFTYTDLVTYRLMDRSYRPPMQNTEVQERRRLLNETYGTFNPDSDFWKQVPATNYLDGVTGAIELHHAVDDTTVSVEYSRNLKRVLEKTSIPHSVFEYSSGGHNLEGSAFSQAMQRTVDFYRKNLGN
jgi:dipeptidyl aminopeptidase/acylaminoacyl peptidase